LGVYSFVQWIPVDETSVQKQVGVLIIGMNCILLSTYVIGCTG